MLFFEEKTILICLLAFATFCNAQTVITADDAVKQTMERNPRVQASLLEIERSKQLQKSSINIPNPEFMFESTTGSYQTLGFIQSFDFPTVYAKQHGISKQLTDMSKVAQQMTSAEIEARVRTAYLDAQYYTKLVMRLEQRDSTYGKIEQAAYRKFMAGETDVLANSYAKMQHADVTRTLLQTQVDMETAFQSLQILMQNYSAFETDEIVELELLPQALQSDAALIQQSLFMKYANENKELSKKQLSLERNKVLPGVVFGYLNQAESKTPFDMRLRGGLTLPLWWWQYAGNIKAAKTQVEITNHEAMQQQQDLTIRLRTLLNDYKKYKTSLNYFETEGATLIAKMTDNSQRLFEAGSIDYITHLRNLNDAFLQEYAHLETLYFLNKTIIQLNYITKK